MTTNIGRDDNDPTYRYKMPLIKVKVEGRGNGIKTVILNMVEVAKSLSRPPSFTTKFFGCELGAQSSFDAKIGRAVVNGKFEASDLQRLLNGFIDRYVLCPNCHLPETDLVIKKDTIRQKCNACGTISDADMMHKLVTFMLKHPEEAKSTVRKGAKAAEEKQKKKREDAADPDVDAPPGADGAGDEQEVEWYTDTSEQATQDRLREARGGAAEKDEHIDITIKELTGLVRSGAAVKDVGAAAAALSVKYHLGNVMPGVLFESLLDPENILKQIETFTPIFVKNCKSPQEQALLLGCLERMCKAQEADPKFMKKVPLILHKFYDQDILEEEVLVKWFDKPTKDFVRKSFAEKIRKEAKPFIDWLKTAETDSEESEEEEVKPAPKPVAKPVSAPAAKPVATVPAPKAAPVAADDDLDIDDI